ncbi:Protein FAR1-RELATED SEQUENCE 5 [Rhynchospora pubera]|uniref:Protein FAR1-RELATED SEQUENCE 5 n=1 Tax=Rhynchospora pubera TaxID=906938 RepID=A0AAV8E999_9POAL|nr:Protein FAR1-RELATED SEQUENCE 5 [Rhynchospora pubera]
MEEHEDDFVPRLGTEYRTLDEAWSVWNYYGGRNGFGVRRGCENKSKKDGVITSKFFVCNCEGKRGVDKRDHLTKNPRAETRTDCQARLLLKFDRGIQKYKIAEFVSDHNPPLQPPEACYLIPSQCKVPEVACFDIQVAASSGISPKNAHELHSRQHGGIRGIGYTMVDHNNCLRNIRKQSMQYGAAIAMTKYFAKRSTEDSSFKYFEDTSEEGEISNVVWTDAKMIASYIRFGDVVIFDTTFGTNNEKWAVGTFVGFNHLREIVIFGAVLMCDQNKESFEWVFTKFLEAHGGKKCITMFTDQDAAIAPALEKIMPDTKHGLCTWHINKNCVKHLSKLDDENDHITKKFNACLYRYEEEKEFEDAINFLMEQVNGEGKEWQDFIYKSKEKWAYCFMKDVYTLGICSTQSSESFNSILKSYLNCKLDVCRFMEQFDRVLEQNREKEIKSEYAMRSKQSILKFKMPILCGASKLYTPKVFELFQAEVELSMLAHIECLEGSTYTVGKFAVDNETSYKSRQVIWNRDDQMISCSCKKFERVGILCWHALKVLDREDIKVIPPRYILNHWTKTAKDDTIVDVEGRRVIEDPMLDVRNRKADMVRMVTPICDEAANNEEDTLFVRKEFLEFQRKYKEYKEKKKDGDDNPTTEHALHLKKKNGGDRRSKRIPSCIEKKKRAKKAKNKTISTSQDSLR